MNRPNPFTMFWGNGLVFVGLCLATCWFTYLSFQDSSAILLAIIALAVTGISKKANARVRAYAAWQREWEAMGGQPSGLNRRAKTILGAFIAWLLMAWLALSVSDDPAANFGATLFWWGSAALPVIALLRALRRAAPRRSARARTKDSVVLVCIRAPARGDGLRQAYAALPEHCRRLLG